MVESLNGYGDKILTGISRYARQKPHWRVAFFDRERKELADLVGSWQGDGIICTSSEARFAEAAATRTIPVVNVSGRCADPVFINVIGDDVQTGAMAADFLLERGFANFAFLRRRENAKFHGDRGRGFSERIAAAGHKVESLLVDSAGDDELGAWIKGLPRPLALLASTDRLASMVIEACWKIGLRIPEEVAVVGIGNYDQLCELCSPSLSSVDMDMERRGFEAAHCLDLVLEGAPAPAETRFIQPAFVAERRSTDIYAFDDKEVVSALRFIHDHASQSIKVGNVVAATAISRRSLESRFNKRIGRTIHDEIWKAHFSLAMRLLSSSDLSLQAVAEQSGFRTASALVNLFRQRFGQTPKEYRIANRLIKTPRSTDSGH